jgi:hypothetical protein
MGESGSDTRERRGGRRGSRGERKKRRGKEQYNEKVRVRRRGRKNAIKEHLAVKGEHTTTKVFLSFDSHPIVATFPKFWHAVSLIFLRIFEPAERDIR